MLLLRAGTSCRDEEEARKSKKQALVSLGRPCRCALWCSVVACVLRRDGMCRRNQESERGAACWRVVLLGWLIVWPALCLPVCM